MKSFKIIMCFIFLAPWGTVHGQKHIYDRYAPYKDLDVAYMENLPIDSANSINATFIIAKDSIAWERTTSAFHLPSAIALTTHISTLLDTINTHTVSGFENGFQYSISLDPLSVRRNYVVSLLVDKEHPEIPVKTYNENSYLMLVNYKRCAIIICSFSSQRQLEVLNSYLLSQALQQK